MYIYSNIYFWVTLLYTRNSYNIVNQLYFGTRNKEYITVEWVNEFL